MSPPVAYATTATTAGSWNGGPDRDRLIKAAHAVLDSCGIEARPSKVRRLVQTFERRVSGNGFDFFHFLANQVQLSAAARRRALSDPDVAKAISWADPTGETAVNNVVRERGF